MPNIDEKSIDKSSSARRWRDILTGHLPLEAETSIFILVNVLDYFMTIILLTSGVFEESNPVAKYFLDHWGPIRGMLYFKLALVTVVCLIAQIVAIKEIKTARWLLTLGTVIVGCVVMYSFLIYLKTGAM